MRHNRSAQSLVLVSTLATLAMTTSGCRVVGDIFKAGVWVGVVVVLVIVGLVAGLARLLAR